VQFLTQSLAPYRRYLAAAVREGWRGAREDHDSGRSPALENREVKTARSLQPHDALLVGRLRIGRLTAKSPPYLLLDAWCGRCKATHCHGWGEAPYRLDAVEFRHAHCPDGELAEGGYWIGPDPGQADFNRAIVRKFIGELAAAPKS